MKGIARVNAERRNGNLHIKLNGRFTPDVAARLTMVMMKIYQGKGNIFIHTDMVTDIAPNSRYAFTNLLKISDLPQDNIYLMGKNGIKICCASLKFIIRKEKKQGACGKCGNCKGNRSQNPEVRGQKPGERRQGTENDPRSSLTCSFCPVQHTYCYVSRSEWTKMRCW